MKDRLTALEAPPLRLTAPSENAVLRATAAEEPETAARIIAESKKGFAVCSMEKLGESLARA